MVWKSGCSESQELGTGSGDPGIAEEAKVGFLAKVRAVANSPTLTTVVSSSGVNSTPKTEETASTEGGTNPKVEVSSTWEEEVPLVEGDPLSTWEEEVPLVEGNPLSPWEEVPLVEGNPLSTWDPLTKSCNCPLTVGKNPPGARMYDWKPNCPLFRGWDSNCPLFRGWDSSCSVAGG